MHTIFGAIAGIVHFLLLKPVYGDQYAEQREMWANDEKNGAIL